MDIISCSLAGALGASLTILLWFKYVPNKIMQTYVASKENVKEARKLIKQAKQITDNIVHDLKQELNETDTIPLIINTAHRILPDNYNLKLSEFKYITKHPDGWIVTSNDQGKECKILLTKEDMSIILQYNKNKKE